MLHLILGGLAMRVAMIVLDLFCLWCAIGGLVLPLVAINGVRPEEEMVPQ